MRSNTNVRNENFLSYCRAQLGFCKDNASEFNESLLSYCRAQLSFCKGNASERNESLLSYCRVQLSFCKGSNLFWKHEKLILTFCQLSNASLQVDKVLCA